MGKCNLFAKQSGVDFKICFGQNLIRVKNKLTNMPFGAI
jgi:hypothetical protein